MRTFLRLSLFLLGTAAASSGSPSDRIWQGGSASLATQSCDLKIASWNIERGERLQEIAAALKQLDSAVVLLQEVDRNAKRTGNRDVAGRLAAQTGLNYLFAAEFEELGQSVRGTSAYHGQAILTALPVASTRIIRFQAQTSHWKPRWYLPNWSIFQRRSGGRLALAVELGAGPSRLVAYNVHLESREGAQLRFRQMQEILADARRYPSQTPVVIAGDFNTRDPGEPVVHALHEAGFQKAVGKEITTTHGNGLDWIFVRGPVKPSQGTIHRGVRASDHFPLTVRLRLETSECR
jgi:endonuclease/exonuclease/phosphatase family metal-dependent hydrolase